MAASVRSFTATPSSGGVDHLDAPKPAGTVSGDVLYAHQFADSSTDGQMTATGWTQVGATASNAGVLMKLWRKVAGGSEPSTYTFNCGSGADTLVIIRCVMGADTTTPEDGASATATGSSASQSAPAVSPSQADSLLLCAVASSRASGGISSYTPPSGMTEEGDVQCSVPFGGFLFGSGASLQLSASGSTGTKTFLASSSQSFVASSVAVRSSAGASGVVIQDRPTGLWLAGPRTVDVVRSLQLVDFPTGLLLGGPSQHTVVANIPGAPSDDFNRPDTDTLNAPGHDWAEWTGSWAINSNRAVLTGVGIATLLDGDFNVDNAVEADIIIPPTGDVVMGVCTRMSAVTELIGAEIVRTATQQKVVAFSRFSGNDREIGSTGVPVSTGIHHLKLTIVGRDVQVDYDSVPVLVCRLSDGEHAQLNGFEVGLVGFSTPAGSAWDNFNTDLDPDPIVVPAIRASFDHADVDWLESGGSINGWHEWASSSPAWRVVSNAAAQLTSGYAPITAPVGQTNSFGSTLLELGPEFWLLFRARDDQNYYRFGRSGSGNYTVQKIEANGLGVISGESNPGGTITPLSGDRLVVTERVGPGFDCYVVRSGVPTLFWSATDTEWEEYADQAGLAAFDSPLLRFDDFTADTASGDLGVTIPLQVVDLAGELTDISSELDLDIPLVVVALTGGVEETVAGTLAAEIPLQQVALTGAGPNSGQFSVDIPMVLVELSSISDAVPPDTGVDVRPIESDLGLVFDLLFPVKWPGWRWARRRV